MLGKSCFVYQRYQLLKAIHNSKGMLKTLNWVVSYIKDTNYWKQFTTSCLVSGRLGKLFRISKIPIIESNSQLNCLWLSGRCGCFVYQRYQLLKAIHNTELEVILDTIVVSYIKDTNYWKQFTTSWLCCLDC